MADNPQPPERLKMRIDFGHEDQTLKVGTVWRVIAKNISCNGYVPEITLERVDG
jgi:hypothetical protein